MFNGRKPCDFDCRKNQYIQHVKRLEAVKSGNTPFHRSLTKSIKQTEQILKLSHRIHHTSLKQQFKKREFNQIESHRQTYNNVRSIIKSELNRKIPTVPSRHKPNTYFLDKANLNLINKIVNVKSQFNFKRTQLEKIVTPRIRSDLSEDYSNLYQKSTISHVKHNRINLKIGKSKLNNRLIFHFLDKNSLDGFKKQSLFIILLEYGDKNKSSKYYSLQQIIHSQINISFPDSEIMVYFLQKIGQRNIKRFKISFNQTEINSQQKIWTSKIIEDMKGRAIGMIQLEIKKRKGQISKNIFYDQIIHTQTMKQKEEAIDLCIN